MNVIQANKKGIIFCLVDNTRSYQDDIRSLIKNQADGVLASLHLKDYTVLQWIDEDALLKKASEMDYDYAVVFSTGNEFINGNEFFQSVSELIKQDFFIAGHILDRGDAYYELHQQCYIVNLKHFRNLGNPLVGKQHLGFKHEQVAPERSLENYHDDYTPLWILPGKLTRCYNHQCHGWNLIKVGLENNLPILVFDSTIRNSKKHFYPESPKDFYKNLSWAYRRLYYCKEVFVHSSNTEEMHLPEKRYKQIITPASGTWFTEYSNNETRIVMYDYNQKSLDYWKERFPSYEFVLTDLLVDNSLIDTIDPSIDETLVNLSNIFNYEGTYFFYSHQYRLQQETKLIEKIKKINDKIEIYRTMPVEFTEVVPTWRL